jgi:diaminohydroxyphosphoribosylaminopyrimidine deaminase/5-amino-6-(5-phosphoribosylamino)uracil reductase
MQRCLKLAEQGRGQTAPNPMVGCVVVHKGKIIGEGFHRKYGEAHAEVNAIAAVKDPKMLTESTLYVSLEPCSHFGKTPPCADLIVSHHIPMVVIGCIDTFSLVQGRGIEKLIRAGIDVKTGILEKECRELNKRFFTFHEKKRPYIILKWAETADGFMDTLRQPEAPALSISSPESLKLLHTWRSLEQAILVGTGTALLDNPRLTVRNVTGNNPIRVVLDASHKIPNHFHLKDGSTPTVVYANHPLKGKDNLEYAALDFSSPETTLKSLLDDLYRRNIQSLLVEGGATLLSSFLKLALWDELRIFKADFSCGQGIAAPIKPELPVTLQQSGKDQLLLYRKAL